MGKESEFLEILIQCVCVHANSVRCISKLAELPLPTACGAMDWGLNRACRVHIQGPFFTLVLLFFWHLIDTNFFQISSQDTPVLSCLRCVGATYKELIDT